MKQTDAAKSLHIIENMIRRRLKAQGKDATDQWIKEKALEVYDKSSGSGEYIYELEV